MLPRPREAHRPVSGGGRRSEERSRQRGFRRPIKTLAAAGISGFSSILNIYEAGAAAASVDTVEVAEAAAFLLSDAGKGVTGEVLLVDAGFHVTGM